MISIAQGKRSDTLGINSIFIGAPWKGKSINPYVDFAQ